MTEVSVVVPNYNQTQYLTRAIESLLRQTLQCFEIIVVDDGSTDNCRETVQSFGDRIRYIRQNNQGLAGARNTGIRAARGHFVALLDADDEWRPEFLQRMLQCAADRPDAAVYFCCAQAMDAYGRDLPQIFGGPANHWETLYRQLLRANCLIPSTILMRKQAVLDAGLFDPALRSCEDWDLWLRMLPSARFSEVGETLVRYRIHSSSLSTQSRNMQQSARSVIEKNFGAEDGLLSNWPKEKRWAYGGLYRYFVVNSIQREGDWTVGASYLQRALQMDTTLAADLDLFYDLVLGAQAPGYRGTSIGLDLHENTRRLLEVLDKMFLLSGIPALRSLRRKTYGTALFAAGLVAYNTRHWELSRRCLLKAILFRPELAFHQRVSGNFVKSFILPWLPMHFRRR